VSGDQYGRPFTGRRARGDRYGVELEASEVDELIVHPASGWQGARATAPTFGRLYRSRGDHRLSPADQADPAVTLGRSGSSGYRGSRPYFGSSDPAEFGAEDPETEITMGPLQYKGPQFGGVVLGLAAVLLLWRMR
jgi:hypothetical protein